MKERRNRKGGRLYFIRERSEQLLSAFIIALIMRVSFGQYKYNNAGILLGVLPALWYLLRGLSQNRIVVLTKSAILFFS